MDRLVQQAIEKLENTSIKPFLHLRPGLAIIIKKNEEENGADYSYLRTIKKRAEKYNTQVFVYKCDNAIEASSIIVSIKSLPHIHGILIISNYGEATRALYDMIPRRLDIGGLSSVSLGNLFGSTNPIAYRTAPSTPVAVLKLLQELMEEKEDTLISKRIAIIGRSIRVGRPLAELLIQQDASVMMFHSKSAAPIDKFANFDVVISAMGKPKYLDASKINPQGKILIDVGVNVTKDGKICGDFDYENLKGYADYISPVPGGVGPLTTTCTFAKLFVAARQMSVDTDNN